MKNVTRLADSYRNRLTQDDNSSLPLIAYYPVERVVLDIPLKIKKHHSFDQLDGYDNALRGGFSPIFWLTALLDISESLRARWFLLYTTVFGVMGFTGLTRLLLTYIQLCMAILPVFVLLRILCNPPRLFVAHQPRLFCTEQHL